MKNVLLSALLGLATLTGAHAQSAQMRSVSAFHAIKVGSGIQLELTAGHGQRVEVSANVAEFANYIRTTVEDGVLTIGYDNPNDRNGQQRSRQHVQLRASVTADQLTALVAGSGSSVKASGDIDADDFKLDISSGATVKADISTATLAVRQSSGSTTMLDGRATSLDVQAGSGATFNGKDLRTDRCRAQASSGSSIQIAVKDDLVAEASSGASISYSGSPQLTKRVSSGASVSGH
ncbi:head GIN domain-containing protein [Hymenobacter bucti]|uniref:Head GIN domain-containing protein n=1 Tax=Hymenobacter bucti TaxID=1844114 RepID=A0ABW4QR17_9BACT